MIRNLLVYIMNATAIDNSKQAKLRSNLSVAQSQNPVVPAIKNGSTASAHTETEIMHRIFDTMEQGILVWSSEGLCEFYNKRVFDVMELAETQIYIGRSRADFLTDAVIREEMSGEARDKVQAKFERALPFSFDRVLPSNRVVATNARPLAEGGFVVTFTDVTEPRRQQTELGQAKQLAESAEVKARDALEVEKTRKRENRLLSELGEWLQSCKSLDELFEIISRFMAKLFPGTIGELYVYSNSRDVLDGACNWNSKTIQDHIQPDDCWSLRRGRMYKYGAGLVDFACTHVVPEDTPGSSCKQSYLCIPIIAHGDTVGLLHIRFEDEADQVGPKPVHDALQSFALRCSEQISLAIANVKLRDELREQSTKDPLTGLFNRRYFLDACRRSFNMAAANDQTVGLIFFDADNFKTFNDHHGHDAGDIVLRSIADAMHKQFSGDEIPCRFGGEEFTVLVPGKSKQETADLAEQLRMRIEQLVVRYRESELPKVTISVGVAAFPEAGRQVLDVINSADDAVYRAKALGKNRVCVDNQPDPIPQILQNENDQ